MAGKIMRLDPISKEVSTEMEALANYLPTEIAVGIQKRKKRSPNPLENMKQRLAGGGGKRRMDLGQVLLRQCSVMSF